MHVNQDHLTQRIRDHLATRHDVREVRMFGGLAFMVDDRMAVSVGRDGDLLVRTDAADYDELLARGGVPAVMGTDRPMGQGWITVPGALLAEDGDLASWVEVGIDSGGTDGV